MTDKWRTIHFNNSSDVDDRTTGIDGWIETMPVAGRRMYRSINEYGEISLREIYGVKAEVDKLRNGEFQAILYIYEFDDVYYICKVSDLRKALLDGLFRMAPNTDGITAGHYLKIGLIPHLIIPKEGYYDRD